MALIFFTILGEWVDFTLRPLYPREGAPVPIDLDSEWASEAKWTIWKRSKYFPSTGIRTRVSRSLVCLQHNLGCVVSTQKHTQFQEASHVV